MQICYFETINIEFVDSSDQPNHCLYEGQSTESDSLVFKTLTY